MQKPIAGSPGSFWRKLTAAIWKAKGKMWRGEKGRKRWGRRQEGETTRRTSENLEEGARVINKSKKIGGRIVPGNCDLLKRACRLWWPRTWAIKGNVYFQSAAEPWGPKAHKNKQKYCEGFLENPKCEIYRWASPYL